MLLRSGIIFEVRGFVLSIRQSDREIKSFQLLLLLSQEQFLGICFFSISSCIILESGLMFGNKREVGILSEIFVNTFFMRQKYLLSLVLVLLWLTLVVCFYMFLSATGRTFETFFFEIYNFIQKSGVWGVAFFVILYCIRPLFFIIATPFDLLSGLIF